MGCGAKELGIFEDAAGVWNFLEPFLSRGFMEFSSPGPRFKEFRGFPGIELGIFRVAKSSGEGRSCCVHSCRRRTTRVVTLCVHLTYDLTPLQVPPRSRAPTDAGFGGCMMPNHGLAAGNGKRMANRLICGPAEKNSPGRRE